MSCLLGCKLSMSVLGPCRTCGYCLRSSISTYQGACSGGENGALGSLEDMQRT